MKNLNCKTMRKLVLTLLMLLTLSLNAQVKFMGIPVDGSRSKMEFKLRQKGFRPISETDYLRGEFNGENALVAIETYKKKVYSVSVMFGSYFGDPFVVRTGYDARTVKEKFNDMVYMFNNNEKYLNIGFLIGEPLDPMIDNDEDIEYQIMYNNKKYHAYYRQIDDEKSNVVHFGIVGSDGDYYIALKYENLDNRPDGEDF